MVYWTIFNFWTASSRLRTEPYDRKSVSGSSKRLIIELLAKHTKQTIEKITAETERDRYMTANEAKEYGLIDDVLHEENEDKKSG